MHVIITMIMARNIEFDEDMAIQKAMAVFWKKGFSGTTIRDLTEAMDINSSSLYNTIGDKHQLFVKCISNYTKKGMVAAGVYSNFESPIQAVISFVNNSVNTIISGNSCMAIQTTFELASSDAEIQALIMESSDFIHQMLLKLIIRAQELKEISEDIEAETTTNFIISSFTGWQESYILHRDSKRIKKMAQLLIGQISNNYFAV